MNLDVHIISHTHWDREWYLPLERFRQRLVALIDEVLDDRGSIGSFLLDGQAIVLDDYLDVRPERLAALSAALQHGRLEAGPWYVLGDELIPGGEAMIRNLLTGRRTLARFGVASPPVLYCPDSFGHPAALPALAAGFGLPLIILWRGYGGRSMPSGDTAIWTSPGGDRALLLHLPRDGYEYGSHLPPDDAGAQARWSRMRGELASRSATGVLLIQNGADHHARQLRHGEAIAALERAGDADGVHRSSLGAFARAIVERSSNGPLPVIRGELRDSYGYTWTLQGTFGTRAHEKRLNAQTERLLLREAEPWCALASRAGARTKPLLDAAWRTLLTAHPHDTLCGCSIDEVAEAMELRLRSAANQARGIIEDSVQALIGHDAPTAHEARDRWRPIAIVRNPVPRIRSGVALIDVEEFIADVPVGPGSAPAGESPSPARRHVRIPALGAVQVLSHTVRNSRIESPRHYPDNDLVSLSRVAAWLTDAPSYGIASFAIGSGAARHREVRNPVVAGPRRLENGLVSVTVGGNGAVVLESVAGERRIESLFDFVDEVDVGDLYTPAPRQHPFAVLLKGVRQPHRGPLRGQMSLSYDISDGSAGARGRIAHVIVHLVVDAGAAFVRLNVTGTNWRGDHRLRLVVRSDFSGGEVWADAAFGMVRREPIVIVESDAAIEQAPPTAPLHRYVSQWNRVAGATLFSDGLAEYEARDDGSFLVTLVRAVGELSRNNLPERPGHAGWPTPTPLAQCIGPFEGNFALLLHGARDAGTIDEIERAADDVLNPLTGATLRSALSLPDPVIGVELIGEGLSFSACKPSEDGAWLVLRSINLCDKPVRGYWRVPFAVADASLARLDESVISTIEADGDSIAFDAAPHQIVTVLVR